MRSTEYTRGRERMKSYRYGYIKYTDLHIDKPVYAIHLAEVKEV